MSRQASSSPARAFSRVADETVLSLSVMLSLVRKAPKLVPANVRRIILKFTKHIYVDVGPAEGSHCLAFCGYVSSRPIMRIGVIQSGSSGHLTIYIAAYKSTVLQKLIMRLEAGCSHNCTPQLGFLVVTLTSSDTLAATTPATVTISAMQISAAFTILGVDDLIVDVTQSTSRTARTAGYLVDSASLDLTDDDLPGFMPAETLFHPGEYRLISGKVDARLGRVTSDVWRSCPRKIRPLCNRHGGRCHIRIGGTRFYHIHRTQFRKLNRGALSVPVVKSWRTNEARARAEVVP